MDLEIRSSGSGSFSRTISAGSSLRRRSFNFSNAVSHQNDDDLESETVSEAGDIGDRALHCNSYTESGRLGLPVDNVIETGSVVPIPKDPLLQSHGFHDPTALATASSVSPSPMETISSLSTLAITHSNNKKQENKKEVPWLLEYISCLLHLAVFGILG